MKNMFIVMITGALSSHWWSKCSILSPFKLTHTLFQVKPLEYEMFLAGEIIRHVQFKHLKLLTKCPVNMKKIFDQDLI